MRSRLTTVFITLSISTCLIGCMSKVKVPTYYTLHVPPAADLPIVAETRASVAVREFRSPAYLRQGAVVYRASPEEVGFYDYHRWAVDPREFLTDAIMDRLRASGKFAEVKIYDGRSDVDFILRGVLEKLEEVDYDGGVRVEVALSAQLTELRSGKTVWTNAASEIAKVNERTVPAVVAEMSHAMDRAIQKLLASLIQRAISRSREYEADHTGAGITGNPMGLARALDKIDKWSKQVPMHVDPSMAHLYCAQPLTTGKVFSSLFSTHPPISQRLERLIGRDFI